MAARSKIDRLCVQCAVDPVDAPRSESLCLWCSSAPSRATRMALVYRRRHAALVAGYRAGASLEDLAVRHGCALSTVHRRLTLAGVRLRPRGQQHGRVRRVIPIDEIVELYAAGWSLERIGERLGVSHATVRARLVTRGVQIRPTGRPPRRAVAA